MARWLGLVGVFVFVVGLVVAGVVYRQPLWVAQEQIRFHLWRQGVRSGYVEAGGYRLHYFEAMPPPGTPEHTLVLIHGLGAKGEDWSGMIPGLAAAGFHVYVPDLLGYGRSPQPADAQYGIPQEEQIVMAFLDAVGAVRTDVAGWSMGGWVAMRIAVDHPERVRRLLLYDSAGTYFPPRFDASLFVPTDEAGVMRLVAMLMPHPPTIPGFVRRDALRTLRRNGWVVQRSMASMESGKDLMDFRLGAIRGADADCVGGAG